MPQIQTYPQLRERGTRPSLLEMQGFFNETGPRAPSEKDGYHRHRLYCQQSTIVLRRHIRHVAPLNIMLFSAWTTLRQSDISIIKVAKGYMVLSTLGRNYSLNQLTYQVCTLVQWKLYRLHGYPGKVVSNIPERCDKAQVVLFSDSKLTHC